MRFAGSYSSMRCSRCNPAASKPGPICTLRPIRQPFLLPGLVTDRARACAATGASLRRSARTASPVQTQGRDVSAVTHRALPVQMQGRDATHSLAASTVALVMFGKPLLNNVLRLDHAQLQMIRLFGTLGDLPIFSACQTLAVPGYQATHAAFDPAHVSVVTNTATAFGFRRSAHGLYCLPALQQVPAGPVHTRAEPGHKINRKHSNPGRNTSRNQSQARHNAGAEARARTLDRSVGRRQLGKEL